MEEFLEDLGSLGSDRRSEDTGWEDIDWEGTGCIAGWETMDWNSDNFRSPDSFLVS